MITLVAAVHNRGSVHRQGEPCTAVEDCGVESTLYCDSNTRTCLSKRADYRLCESSEQCSSFPRNGRNGGCLEVPPRSTAPTATNIPLSFEGDNPTTITQLFCLAPVNNLFDQAGNIGQPCYADGQCPQPGSICREVPGASTVSSSFFTFFINNQKYCLGARLGDSQSCIYHEQCITGVCERNICRPVRLAADAVCSYDAQCSSVRCLTGRCQRAASQPEVRIQRPVVQFGGIADIAWTTRGIGPGGCAASGSGVNELRYLANSPTDTWGQVNQHSGSFRVRLSQPQTFTLTCRNSAGSATQTVTIDPATAPRIPPPFVYYDFEAPVLTNNPYQLYLPDISGNTQRGGFGGLPRSGDFNVLIEAVRANIVAANPGSLSGNYYRLDGADDYITRGIRGEHIINFDGLSATIGYHFPNGWTISFWVKPNQFQPLAGTQGLLSWREDDIARDRRSSFSYVNIDSDNGQLRWYLDGAVREVANPQRMVNSWNNIVIMNDRNQYYLFLNGNLVGSYVDEDNSFTSRRIGARNVHLGAAESNQNVADQNQRVSQPAVYFNGLVDEFKFFNYAFNINNVAEIYRELAQDRDNDLIFNVDDNCPDNYNPGQEDLDGYQDNLPAGDACEVRTAGGAPPAGITGQCGTGETSCRLGCVNLNTNQANCGTCDRPCGPAQSCQSGVCRDAAVPPPAEICDNRQDDDQDTRIDCSDSDCDSISSCRSDSPTGSTFSIIANIRAIGELIRQVAGGICTTPSVSGCENSDVNSDGRVDIQDVFQAIDDLKARARGN